MRLATLPVALVVLTALFAGCADDTPKSDAGPAVPESAQDVEVTDTTGAIRGIVVDETITPIEGATVTVTGVSEPALTAADGGFVFNGLEPGDYFVSASKFGFQTMQSAASVEAGVKDPGLVRISLPRLAGEAAAYANTQHWQGFIQCALIVVAAGGQLCGELDERYINRFSVDAVPTYAQAEMHWKSTQTLSPKLILGFYPGTGIQDWKDVQGPSPLLLQADQGEFIDEFGEDMENNPMRVFPPGFDGEPNTVLGIGVNQAFDVYLTQFYGFLPRDDYRFAIDGPCTTFDDCGKAEG